MKKKFQRQLQNKYSFELIGLLIVVVMFIMMSVTAQYPQEIIILDIPSTEQFIVESSLPTDLSPINILQIDTVYNTNESSIVEEVEDETFNESSIVEEVEDETFDEEEEVLVTSIISINGYDNVWISHDGLYAYRFHTGDWDDARRGRADGMTVQPWILDILYNTWSQYPQFECFDYLLGLIMKESNGRHEISIIDRNGQRSTGLLQYNDWQGRMDGNSMAIIWTSRGVPLILLGRDAINARDNNPNCVWFVESWDATDIQMVIDRWCIYNSILLDNGWSLSKVMLAHRFGAYSSSLNNNSLQTSEMNAIRHRIRTNVTPYRLI